MRRRATTFQATDSPWRHPSPACALPPRRGPRLAPRLAAHRSWANHAPMPESAAPTRSSPDRHTVPAAQVVIATEGLTKIYPGDILAVDHLDLSVGEGEIFGLLGPNGAGKTTTEGMLTTRVLPTEGRAFGGGIDVVADPARPKRVIGVVPQTNTLDRALSVWENLYFHGRYFGMGAKAARAAADYRLEQFRLADRAGAPVMALSGGMAQRLMVARAILHEPAILFLDEPTAGLDPQSRLALWEIMGELHRGGQTIMLSTHHMEEADRLCNRVAIMDHGRILALDSPHDLKQSLGADTEVVVTADGAPEGLAAHLKAKLGELRPGSDVRVVEDKVRVALKGVEGALPLILSLCEQGGFAVRDLSVTEPTLETVFISLTGKDLRE